jgi:hypothetical protein
MAGPDALQLIQVSVSIIAVVAALGAVALTHYFASWRDRRNKQREQRISYLVSAYRALCKANNHPRLHEVADDVEQAVADIQLLGSSEQIKLVQAFATELGEGRSAELNPLLNSLRDSLRDELGADRTMRRLVWLRIGRQADVGSANERSETPST